MLSVKGMKRRHSELTVGEADSELGRLPDVPHHRRAFSRPHLVFAGRVRFIFTWSKVCNMEKKKKKHFTGSKLHTEKSNNKKINQIK